MNRAIPEPEPILEDYQLIRSVIDGDAKAERRLYERHVDRIYRLAYRMTGDPTMAEDMTQDIFIRAFDRLESFRFEASFSTWLHALAGSVILNGLRSLKRIRAREVGSGDVEIFNASVPAPDHDLKRRLAAAMAELSEDYRMAVVMHDMEGYTHHEIASATGTPVGTAKARLSRAREQLRKILERPGPGCGLEME